MKNLIILLGLTISLNLWADINESCSQEAESVIENYLYDINYQCLDKTQGNWMDKDCVKRYHEILEKDMQDYYDLCVNSTNV